jgi:hypothetical protein
MSSEPVWIVIESVSPIQLPILTLDQNRNSMRLNTSLHQPLWSDLPNSPLGINFHNDIYPEPQNFTRPQNFHNKDSLSSIKLVGIFANLESAQLAVGCAPNRKLLGPGVVQ